MKKFAAIALALILAMSSMFATVGVAGSSEEAAYDNNELSIGFIVEDKGVVVDVENMRIYGLKPELTVSELKADYLDADVIKGFSMNVTDEAGNILADSAFVGTGSKIVLNDGEEDHPFKVVIFGDLTGDSAIDVIDAAMAQRYHTGKIEAPELAVVAGDADKDGEIDVNDYALQVNAAVGNDGIGQNATGTEDAGIVEVEEQVYVSGDETKYALADEDVTLTYNDIEVDSKYFDISDVKYVKDAETSEIYGEVTITGKGLFHGEITLKIEVVSLLEKAVATVNEVIEDANLANVVEAKYELVDGVADIKVNVNASKIIRGQFNVDMNGLNGLLTKIDEFKARHLQEVSLTVGDLAIANNGDFDRSAIKALVFDIAKGIFCDIANADDNVVKSYSGSLVTNNELAELTENFNIDVVMTADADIDIDRVKAFAAKISRYVAFDVVDGNAVIDITMPAGFATKVVDVLGGGDVAKATADFNNMDVATALVGYLAKVEAEDISAGSVAEIEQAMNVALMLVDLANKALGEVADATVTSNVMTMPLLSGRGLNVDETESNKFGAIVKAFAVMLSNEVLATKVGDFYNDGVYTVSADVELDYRNIKETVIVNFDLFGAAETPDIIEETATYFSDIIDTLGLANIAAVSYDAENCRALATLNARELATNLTLNEEAFDGLYTDIKGYFDDNYGTATIVVDGKEIVTAGKINKSALKDLIFSVATGFFQDAANLGANNVLRSLNTVVTEADGTVHNFDLDFALAGSVEDVERVASIAAKVAKYVSFEVVDGNAVVNVGLPEGMREKVIAKLGGDAESAQALFNEASVAEALMGYLAKVDPSDISVANADEIQAIIDMIASVDNIVNKVLGKVSYATVYDVNGNALPLLSDRGFNVATATVEGLVEAVAVALNDDVLNNGIVNYMNADGTYTVKCDAGLTIGGIKETVIVNLDIFGDYEKKTAIEDTVDYVEEIFADLGVASFADVEYADGKAVATFNATALLNDGLKSINADAIDGLYTKVKDYFNANFSDSTITVGDYVLVKDGTIDKTAVKDLLFSAATGFFTDVANMDAKTIRSYNTVVVDGEGNVEEFAFDFNLGGLDAHIEKLQVIAGKVAELVSFKEVDGNAAVTVSLPAGMKNNIVERFGSEETARETINNASVADLLVGYIGKMDASDVSVGYADEIERAIGMISDVAPIIDKLISKVSDANVYDVNGNAYDLFSNRGFDVEDTTVEKLAEAVAVALGDQLLGTSMANFANENGTYTITCDVTVKGITEKVTFTFDLF